MAAGWLGAAVQMPITPPVGYPMEGYAARTGPSEGVHDSLYAGVLALQQGERRHVLIVADLLWIVPPLYRRVQERLAARWGLDATEWSVVATHTHSGPRLSEAQGGWLDVLADGLAGAVGMALRALAPVTLRAARTQVPGIGVNRRRPDGPVDPELPVLVVEEAVTGRLVALLYNFACHPVVLGPANRLYSADYPGYVRAALQAVYGSDLVALFTCGAAGDVNTGHTAEASAIGEFIPHRTYRRAEQIGRRLAGAIIACVEAARAEARPGDGAAGEGPGAATTTTGGEELGCREGSVTLAFRDFPDPERLSEQMAALDATLRRLDPADPQVRRLRIERMYAAVSRSYLELRQAYPGPSRDVPVRVVALGPVRLFMVPGELFVELGLRLKAQAAGLGGPAAGRGPSAGTEPGAAPVAMVVGYANDYVGYLPTRDAFRAGGYEAVATAFTEDAGERVVAGLLALVE